MMNRKLLSGVVALTTVCVVGASSQAATLVVSGSAPAVNGGDISNFVSGGSDGTNVNGGGDDFTYVAGGRPDQGQSFTTGAVPSTLNAVTVQHRTYPQGFNDVFNYDSATVRIGTLSGGVFSAVATETIALTPANGFSSDAGGEFVTFNLGTPVNLLPNTVYAFILGSPGGYFELNGIDSATDVYANGQAFTTTTNGTTPTFYDTPNAFNERVFHADITAIPEPASIGVLALASLGLIARRRKA